MKRIIVVVLDGVGVGALPDAPSYGDAGADTLGNIAEAAGGLSLPALERLGLGAVADIKGLSPVPGAGAYGKMAEASAGKDSSIGHWELAGVAVDSPYPTFPSGFPREIIEAFESRIGRSVIGNYPASGTAIVDDLGAEHLASGVPIVYTSVDSVFQIAAHVDVIPLEELYRLCLEARELFEDLDLPILRVIARPFTGLPGGFTRVPGRRDFSLPPPGTTVFEALEERGVPVLGVGKVGDLYSQRGMTECWKTVGNEDGMNAISRALIEWPEGLVIANLIDFDTLFGHRNDTSGFVRALQNFDRFLGEELLPRLDDGDVVCITSDHGCDPTRASTDHSREHVPILVSSPRLKGAVPLGTRETFADLAATLFEAFGGGRWTCGKSFWAGLPIGREN